MSLFFLFSWIKKRKMRATAATSYCIHSESYDNDSAMQSMLSHFAKWALKQSKIVIEFSWRKRNEVLVKKMEIIKVQVERNKWINEYNMKMKMNEINCISLYLYDWLKYKFDKIRMRRLRSVSVDSNSHGFGFMRAHTHTYSHTHAHSYTKCYVPVA